MAIDLVIPGRAKNLGGFTVRRVLPFAKRRLVGPFIFWDEMGPADFAPGQGIDVRPHPHIGLSTVTWLFDGEITHRDTTGAHQSIRPGDLNWMSAGRGVAHSERTGAEVRGAGHRLHGIQAWVAAPAAHEEDAPSFIHHPAADLPRIDGEGVRGTVIAGTAFGAASPARGDSPLFYAQLDLDAGAAATPPAGMPERAAYVVSGAIEIDGARIEAGDMAVLAAGGAPAIRAADGPARVMAFGGEPLAEPRFIEWNFVSSRQERIEQAKRDWTQSAASDWRNTPFVLPQGDDSEHIPLPGTITEAPEPTPECPTT